MSTSHAFDLVVLGGGAAAFAAITEADRRDISTAIINAGLPLGGTCVNVGCVPSKHLLEVGKTAFEPLRNRFNAVRYESTPIRDWAAAIEEKDSLVTSLREQNYTNVADRFGTEIFEGYGRFVEETTLEIGTGPDEGATLTGEKILVATGSSPRIVPFDGIESITYETSETILERRDLPERVIMLGGGYVGLEWSQILHHMGTDVTVLQRSDHVLSQMDEQLGQELQLSFQDKGIRVVTNVTVQRVRKTEHGGVLVEAEVDDTMQQFRGSDLFVATGVRPNTANIGLEQGGVETEVDGAITVDKTFQTTNPDVYAAGDCIGKPMLETVAAKEGNYAVKNAFGNVSVSIEYNTVPTVVYTNPEVASVGVTESEYMREHGTCACRTIQMQDVPKTKAVKETRGLVQVVAHHETDEIVGVHMIGPRSADIISEATVAVKFGLTVDDIIDTIHPFPTFSEGFKLACQAFRRDVTTMSCCIE